MASRRPARTGKNKELANVGVVDKWIHATVGDGRYRIVERLGEGGMGLVYRAVDTRMMDNNVVIKTPHPRMLQDPGFAKRFTLEIRSLVELRHPHIVHITDLGEFDDAPFAVMQFCSGGSLSKMESVAVANPRAESYEILDKIQWLMPIAKALDVVREKGYIHRDVKPPNILFDELGNPFLGDFGIAKVVADQTQEDQNASLTRVGVPVGTFGYIAPEAPLGQQSDQYSLAVTLFEFLTGKRPFEGSDMGEVLLNQRTKPAPDVRDYLLNCSKSIEAAIKRALSVEPEDRFPNCEAFAEAVLNPIEELSTLEPVSAEAVNPAEVVVAESFSESDSGEERQTVFEDVPALYDEQPDSIPASTPPPAFNPQGPPPGNSVPPPPSPVFGSTNESPIKFVYELSLELKNPPMPFWPLGAMIIVTAINWLLSISAPPWCLIFLALFAVVTGLGTLLLAVPERLQIAIVIGATHLAFGAITLLVIVCLIGLDLELASYRFLLSMLTLFHFVFTCVPTILLWPRREPSSV